MILDGFGYDVVRKYQSTGGFKNFKHTSPVVAPYPSLTDLCSQDLIQGEQCDSLEARYYHPTKKKIVGGEIGYLLHVNQPYRDTIAYSPRPWIDSMCYVAPWFAFKLEMSRLRRKIIKFRGKEFVAYLVSTAGIGTKYGAAGQNMCLGRVDEFCAELKKTMPSLHISLVSDHGHGYTPSRSFDIRSALRKKGWKFRSRIEQPNDIVYPGLGLVHCAGFWTDRARELVEDLNHIDCIDIISYVQDGRVKITNHGGTGEIWRNEDSYTYKNFHGDVLHLGLADGDSLTLNQDEWLRRALHDKYPDAPVRLWRAHHGLVKFAPSVIAGLKDGFFFGSRFLNRFAKIESTHGGLNRINSLAFAMSSEKELPEIMRTRDVMDNLTSG